MDYRQWTGAKAIALTEQQAARAFSLKLAGLIMVSFVALFFGITAATAEPGADKVKIELNKLEQTDKGCRFFWLVSNQTEMDIKDLDITFYWFQSDGVIGGDLKFAFAPAPPKSLKVKQYMLPDQKCDGFASLLVNELNQCQDGQGAVAECADKLSYASRTSIEFLK